MANAVLYDTANFLRWRLVPVRKLGKVKNQLVGRAAPPRRATSFDPDRLAQLQAVGCCPALPVDQGLVEGSALLHFLLERPSAEKLPLVGLAHYLHVAPHELRRTADQSRILDLP